MKAADRSGAAYVVIVGDEDAARGAAQVKDMATGDQQELPWASLPDRLAAMVASDDRRDAR
jgi:histidyl-tRNA synthetase